MSRGHSILRVLVTGVQPVKAPPDGQSSVAPYTGVGDGTCGAELLTCRNHVHLSSLVPIWFVRTVSPQTMFDRHLLAKQA
jgi:hypothetical protein